MDHHLLLFRFKAELPQVLESFVEEEDEFIKQVSVYALDINFNDN